MQQAFRHSSWEACLGFNFPSAAINRSSARSKESGLMGGHFELARDTDGNCRVNLVDAQGNQLAVSRLFPDVIAAIAGIVAFRHFAATAPIRDHTSNASRKRTAGGPGTSLGKRRTRPNTDKQTR